MPRAQRSGRVRGGVAALLILGFVMLGVAWRYHASVTQTEETEAQGARTTQRTGARVASTRRKVSTSRPRYGAAGSSSVGGSASEPVLTTPVTRPNAAQALAATDPDLPWLHPGMCVGAAGTRTDEERARYLATFVPVAAWRTTLLVHPEVPASAVSVIRDNLERVNGSAIRRIGLPASPPFIYLYPTVASLREHSCASAHAVAYYDGAIHLAVLEPGASASDRELLLSLKHEYAHHVLTKNGIGKPIWFQEGTAMAFAGDGPRDAYALWHEHPIRPSEMVGSFPKTGRLDAATIFYANALVMTDFLHRLCLIRAGCGTAELAEALIDGSASPETLFEWATARRGSDLASTAEVSLWDDYMAHQNFAPATYQALVRRTPSILAGADD